ncbi:hypothetical protein LTR49_027232, partial [Elasticomyces elasticus]
MRRFEMFARSTTIWTAVAISINQVEPMTINPAVLIKIVDFLINPALLETVTSTPLHLQPVRSIKVPCMCAMIEQIFAKYAGRKYLTNVHHIATLFPVAQALKQEYGDTPEVFKTMVSDEQERMKTRIQCVCFHRELRPSVITFAARLIGRTLELAKRRRCSEDSPSCARFHHHGEKLYYRDEWMDHLVATGNSWNLVESRGIVRWERFRPMQAIGPIFVYLGMLAIFNMFHTFNTLYEFFTHLITAFLAAGIIFIVVVQRTLPPAETAKNLTLRFEVSKSILATALWLWLMFDAVFGPRDHSGYYMPWSQRITVAAISSVLPL